MQKTKNIIFDLGGVILSIDFKQAVLAFAELGIGNFNEYYTLQTVSPLFEKLEIGAVEAEDFYKEFRELTQSSSLTDEQIKHAWNALLLDFPPERIRWLKDIKNRYNIYLLSNTNQIHHNAFTHMYKQQIGDGEFDNLFVKTYYSYKMGLRKPSREIFEAVLKDEDLKAAETVFIDDSEVNVLAAESVGMQTIHLPSPKTVLELDL